MLTASFMTSVTALTRPEFIIDPEDPLRHIGLDPIDAPETLAAGSMLCYAISAARGKFIDLQRLAPRPR